MAADEYLVDGDRIVDNLNRLVQIPDILGLHDWEEDCN
jgi:hypothetical protein